MKIWRCRKCGWSGDELENYEEQHHHFSWVDRFRGCPDCQARIGKGIEPVNPRVKEEK